MNSLETGMRNSASKLMMTIKSHDFGKVVKSYKKEHEIDDEEAGLILFQLQRWLTLCILYPDKNYAIGAKVDAMWHTFILFTKDYEDFCRDVAGFFIHHLPDVDDDDDDANKLWSSISEGNQKLKTLENDYLSHFGQLPPTGIWPKPRYIKKGNEGCTSCRMPPPCARCSVGMP